MHQMQCIIWTWHDKFNVEGYLSGAKQAGQLTSYGGARGVMVIVAGYGHSDTSSNPGPD